MQGNPWGKGKNSHTIAIIMLYLCSISLGILHQITEVNKVKKLNVPA